MTISPEALRAETPMRAQLIAMVVPEASVDYWSDDLLYVVAKLVQEIRAAGERDPLDLMSSLDNGARLRLWHAALVAENEAQPAFVPELLAALQQPGIGDEEVDLLVDYLKDWNLKEADRVQLYEAAAQRARSEQVLNRVIMFI